ncbi:hypothetical protein EEL34_05990 [Muribaculaceae bacterium Isolate-039 (Harlan)]|jgi:hypothetical protein|uniref:Imm26 family immunity protein n=3 Tax=Duncaniella TaxID=2518495 RepID=UPI000F47C664|nr:Imm26 family immunity protein [Duncaniella muris]ROS90045.1 hypothetical protein EEL34_05990 [Muribaculaceae bacterium Isolate-039 (Harlan)]ROS98830.1 hypothetical protein EEL40_04260 [Muribaculaceae bacterium Isolate-083 (Janvier)]ROS99599.1 hypothetical protein EEL37_01995 [Muribaculaceae bacterium Isolate-077 (Janvier)]ROT02301.1 hypothetical protein EEL41_01995 [Muribaculaceae bacterium Isolate-084 (Janvier)]
MAKRIVTRIGDIFCVELGNGYKSYFQYMLKDCHYLGGAVIRAFKTNYPVEYEPKIEEIVKDEVAFHALTYLRAGIDENTWYKIGNSKEIGQEELKSFVFGLPQEEDTTIGYEKANELDANMEPYEHWYVGYAGCERKDIGKIPEFLKSIIECDGVLPYTCIVDRIRYGYYTWTMTFYDEVKRKPWPWVDSYVRKADRLTRETTYFHFHGSRAVREVIVDCDGNMTRLSCENPVDGCHSLYAGDFGEINWRYKEFITEDAFEDVWNKSDKSR